MNSSAVRLLAVLLLCLAWLRGSEAAAQARESGVSINQPMYATPANFSIAKPGELTMQVNVWGLVNHPGRYEVSITTDLIQLVSYAGGPAMDADMSAVKVTRFLRTDAGVTKSEFVVDLDRLYRVNDASIILQPGDTIVFDRSGWANFRDILTVVTSVAVVTTAVTTVVVTTRPR